MMALQRQACFPDGRLNFVLVCSKEQCSLDEIKLSDAIGKKGLVSSRTLENNNTYKSFVSLVCACFAGTAKIADVGLARIMQHTLSNTATGDPAGTFAYAAPEMLMGEKWDDKVCIFWGLFCIRC